MDLIIKNADFSAVKIGIDFHPKTLSILSQMTGVTSNAKKIALNNIVRFIYDNGYSNSVARMIVPFAANSVTEALRDVWVNSDIAFENASFNPATYLSLTSGQLVGNILGNTNYQIAENSIQPLNMPCLYEKGIIFCGIGANAIINAYGVNGLTSGQESLMSYSNNGTSYIAGYAASNRTDYIGKLVSYAKNGFGTKYFQDISTTVISTTSGTLAQNALGIGKISTSIGHQKVISSKFALMISDSITDAKLIELKELMYALHLLL